MTSFDSFSAAPELAAAARRVAREARGPLLAMETSQAQASVALVTPDAVLEQSVAARSLPSEALVDTVAAMLREAGVRPTELRGIVAGIGPGSFTGLRVGLATVKGLALGARLPTYGVSSLAVLAASGGAGTVVVALDARRNEMYGAVYEVDGLGSANPRLPDGVFVADAFVAAARVFLPPGARCAGDMAAVIAASLDVPAIAAAPRALLGIIQAATAVRRGEGLPPAALMPRYLRQAAAQQGVSATRP